MTVRMTSKDVEFLRAQAAAESPHECCGLLVGTVSADGVRVVEVHRAANVWEGDRTNRFLIDPRVQLQVQRQCRERGLEIVGFYHSHPTGRAVPSAFDVELAWPEACYVIVAPRAGGEGDVRCWRFEESTKQFVEQEIEIAEIAS